MGAGPPPRGHGASTEAVCSPRIALPAHVRAAHVLQRPRPQAVTLGCAVREGAWTQATSRKMRLVHQCHSLVSVWFSTGYFSSNRIRSAGLPLMSGVGKRLPAVFLTTSWRLTS